MKRFGISPEQRLHLKRDFECIIKEGKRIKGEIIEAWVKENNSGIMRFGVVVPRKLAKKSVKRNRMKRLMREFLRLHQENFRGKDIILVAKEDFSQLKFQDVERKLLEILGRECEDSA